MDRFCLWRPGFCKTEVRCAAFLAVANGAVALLCPTALLAEQHAQTFSDRLLAGARWNRRVSAPPAKWPPSRASTTAGSIVIGTHKILSKDVKFKRLGLSSSTRNTALACARKKR